MTLQLTDEQPGSVWGIVGNIVEERPWGPGGSETRNGTRLFRGGAKIYLAALRHSEFLSEDPGYPASVRVIGQHRKARNWITAWVRARNTTHWRVQLIYDPTVLSRLREEGWPGFLLPEGEFAWPAEERASIEAVAALYRKLRSVYPRHRREAEISPAIVRADGWVRCPGCGRAFATYDRERWDGVRHTTCGQRIEPMETGEPSTNDDLSRCNSG